jgi:CheY-like chemotaxis protein
MSEMSMRILIVEDDALTATALAAALRDDGHEVIGIAETGREALARAARSRADLALVDISLRDGRTGLAAARALREDYVIPSVLISGEAGLDAKADAVRAVGYIAKPVDANDVVRAVSALAESPKLSARRERTRGAR